MRAIKNLNGFVKSLKANNFDVLEVSKEYSMVIVKSFYGIEENLQELYLKTHRVAYLEVGKNCHYNTIIDVCFY